MDHAAPARQRELHPAAPAYIKARMLSELPWPAGATIIFAVLAVFTSAWLWIGAAVSLVGLIWLAVLIPMQVRNLGWLETDDDLLVARGKLWRRFTVIPYGRIQFVDVSAGPIMRWLNLKKVEIHTASATSDSTVRGLDADTADGLRDRLADKARERMSGL
ncbi:PH domain-containing protein [Corynebacterium sp. TAE3-ERU12]|uniref:PH domain-containing protein n=1 Tax=Corynebacterium sp. TAE3-ERU12 TaxID=2849491 RepID=UPI001C495038|nr:PH domain-containing protein [Corynebacterium sp. TAE3-ERU12]MBV7294889.1 PH domain-containing protein [Corynebacterium sp. TAE3-ERU12]